MNRALLVAAVVCATSWAGTARANGRFPFANHLSVDPSDSKHLVLRTTYGIVQTFDDGADLILTKRWALRPKDIQDIDMLMALEREETSS